MSVSDFQCSFDEAQRRHDNAAPSETAKVCTYCDWITYDIDETECRECAGQDFDEVEVDG